MYLKHISVKSYGPIENLSYSFREDEKGNPVPLAIIGKNGCGKTLLFANIVDMFVEMKRQIYPQGILEVNENNYYKVRFLYNGIIIKHQKTEPTYTKTSLFLCEKRRFFMARREKGVVPIIYFEKERGKSF